MDTSHAGGVPLTVLAGIPDELRNPVLTRLKKHFRTKDGTSLRAFEILSGQKKGAEYRNHSITRCLGVLAKRIQIKKDKNQKQSNPTHISVVYLESQQEQENNNLLEKFFSFAQCVKIPRGDKCWDVYSEEDLADLFIKSINSMPSWKNIQGLKRIYLPLKHFTCNDEKLFTVCLKRVKDFPEQPPIVKKVILQSQCIKKKCGRCPQLEGKQIPRDSEGRCFVSSARDGSPYGAEGVWEKVEEGEQTADGFLYSIIYINSYYRFGLPIPTGTHFDVQYPGERQIQEKTFWCPQRGYMPKKACNYVNIYPNDTVNICKN